MKFETLYFQIHTIFVSSNYNFQFFNQILFSWETSWLYFCPRCTILLHLNSFNNTTVVFRVKYFQFKEVSLFPKWKNRLYNVWLKEDFCCSQRLPKNQKFTVLVFVYRKQVKITNMMTLHIFDELFDLFKSTNFNWGSKKTIKLSKIFWRHLNFEIKTFRKECRVEKSQTKQ